MAKKKRSGSSATTAGGVSRRSTPNGGARRGNAAGARRDNSTRTSAESYTYPSSDSPMRPDVGTQAQFKKKKPPQRYRCDSSLSSALDWDGQNAAREEGEALLRRIMEAATLDVETANRFCTSPQDSA